MGLLGEVIRLLTRAHIQLTGEHTLLFAVMSLMTTVIMLIAAEMSLMTAALRLSVSGMSLILAEWGFVSVKLKFVSAENIA